MKERKTEMGKLHLRSLSKDLPRMHPKSKPRLKKCQNPNKSRIKVYSLLTKKRMMIEAAEVQGLQYEL